MARKTDVVKIEEKPVEDGRCMAEYAHMRCYYPWTISDSPSGKRGFCSRHWRADRNEAYRDVILESADWELAQEEKTSA